MKKIKNSYITYILLIILIIVTSVSAFTYLTTYSFTEDFKNNLTENVRIYREAGKSNLEISRINHEKYEYPDSREVKAFGGINIIDSKKFVVLKLDAVRILETEDINVNSDTYGNRFNSYQLHNAKTSLIKHIKAVLQLRKDNEGSMEWY